MTTLSEQQQSKTLAKGKRKRPEKAPKIVLCNPFPKYWPLVDETDAEIIKAHLRTLLVKERGKLKIPWKKFIKLTKEQRKERMEKIYEENIISDDLCKQRKFLKVGLNQVARAIHQMNISFCLLAGDVQPDLVISHLVTLAVTRGTRVLIIPRLKEDIAKILGFSSAALGFKIDNDNDHPSKPLESLVKQICSKFPVPSQYQRIRNKDTELQRRVNKQFSRATVIQKEKQPEISVGDFYIDVTPGPSLDTVSCVSNKAEEKSIPSDPSSINNLPEKGTTQLYEDYMSNLLYIAPKFTQMQKNINRQNKKKKTIPNI